MFVFHILLKVQNGLVCGMVSCSAAHTVPPLGVQLILLLHLCLGVRLVF